MKKRSLSCLLALVLLLSIVPAWAVAETPTSAARDSVVRLVEFFLSDGEINSWGLSTAFFVGKEGEPVLYLVTNYHCVSDYVQNGKGTVFEYRDAYAEKHTGQYRLNVFFDSERTEEAYVVEYDEGQDIALLKLGHTTDVRSPLALQSPDDSMVGDTIYIVGYPGIADEYMVSTSNWGTEDALVAKGTLGRLVTESATGTKWFQSTDMAASKGSSGSPIMTENGAVIGVVSQGSVDGALFVNADITPVIDMLTRNHITFDLAEDRIPKEEPADKDASTETFPEPTQVAEETTGKESVTEKQAKGFFVGLPIWAYAGVAAAMIVIIALIATQSGKKKKAAVAAATTAAVAAVKMERSTQAAAPEKPLRPMVRSLADQHRNRTVQLKTEPVVAGRNPKCSILYKDDTPGVSGTHCSIAWDAANHDFVVKDLGSSYGTYLESGMRLEPNREYRLKPGESIYLGDKANTLRMEVE